eukprot:CAMPEP_0117540150 /NCGR_PEP_ID=MMETSP0784-20121206/43352_1 /TAXON_ID=39447 /ORGANISM="" /LENGTH=39 /DNA_ID= /DNA_START= /DNA_END= /DNA_ORIENTATION=
MNEDSDIGSIVPAGPSAAATAMTEEGCAWITAFTSGNAE